MPVDRLPVSKKRNAAEILIGGMLGAAIVYGAKQAGIDIPPERAAEIGTAAVLASAAVVSGAASWLRDRFAEKPPHKGRSILLGSLVAIALLAGCGYWPAPASQPTNEVDAAIRREVFVLAVTELLISYPEAQDDLESALFFLEQQPPTSSGELEAVLVQAVAPQAGPQELELARSMGVIARLWVESRLPEPVAPIPAELIRDVTEALREGFLRAQMASAGDS